MDSWQFEISKYFYIGDILFNTYNNVTNNIVTFSNIFEKENKLSKQVKKEQNYTIKCNLLMIIKGLNIQN